VGIEPAPPHASALLPGDQVGKRLDARKRRAIHLSICLIIKEDLEVLADRRQRHWQRRRQVGHARVLARETLDDGPPRRIGESAERGIERALL
jgi:hypothetical protein